jgi:hypothetical protein
MKSDQTNCREATPDASFFKRGDELNSSSEEACNMNALPRVFMDISIGPRHCGKLVFQVCSSSIVFLIILVSSIVLQLQGVLITSLLCAQANENSDTKDPKSTRSPQVKDSMAEILPMEMVREEDSQLLESL